MANAASGAGVNSECITKFNELQAKRLHRYVTYKLHDSKEVVIDQVGERGATYEDFVSALPENDCRYAVFDFDYMTPEEVPKSKIYYIFWSPDCAKVRSKMLYASSNSKFKTGLNGIQIEMQATDASEISRDAIQDRIKDRAC
ncbi:actin-depolymerizing factor 3 [Lolium perenne]|uniref:actin-depolymerizing factor 3 n=1 Tax=Lolium perenne TaxID=4522 RepID=UPI0021F525A7|nr:actin-depolymerizing factor 3-like [Lolium perenne]